MLLCVMWFAVCRLKTTHRLALLRNIYSIPHNSNIHADMLSHRPETFDKLPHRIAVTYTHTETKTHVTIHAMSNDQ